MLIECIAKVSGTVETAISNDVYVFRPDYYGRLVCDVDREEHIAAFLSVVGVYRAAEALPDGAVDAAPADPEVGEQAAATGALSGLTWDELAALYEERFGRKPHSKSAVATLVERLTA